MSATRLRPAAAARIARRHRALGDPTRLLILDFLLHAGEAPVGEIAAAVGASQQNASKHLAVLRAAEIVVRRRQGTSSLHRVADPRFCRGALDPS